MMPLAKGNCRVNEVECGSILNKSGLADYTVNCYSGCEHACCYCYARFVTRFSHPGEPWGSFVDVKVNAARILEHEVKRKKSGTVFLSSVCDGWQPLEARYQLTRQCLEILRRYRYPVTILTKNALAIRDLDILVAAKDGIELGATITTLDEGLRRLIEPASSPSAKRLELLHEARRKGIRTYAFLGPLLPELSDTEANVDGLLREIKDADVDYFYVDRLNRRFGVWQALKAALSDHFAGLLEVYRKILFDEVAGVEYREKLMFSVMNLARKYGLDDRMRICF